jgi:hypothetical protein
MTEQPIIAIFCAFTRPWAVELWLKNLEDLDYVENRTHLCFIVDGDFPEIKHRLEQWASLNLHKSSQIRMNENWEPNEVNIKIRRERVAEIHDQGKELVGNTDAQIVIGLEDDTVFDRLKNLDRLLDPLLNEEVGFVEGVQMGRWGARMIGAWLADDDEQPREIRTLLPPRDIDGWKQSSALSYQEITGGGWYGYATQRSLFMGIINHTNATQPWGPDVNFGFYLRRRGLKCFIDWSLVFGHNDHGRIKYPDDPDIQLTEVIFKKDDSNGKWNRTDIDRQ